MLVTRTGLPVSGTRGVDGESAPETPSLDPPHTAHTQDSPVPSQSSCPSTGPPGTFAPETGRRPPPTRSAPEGTRTGTSSVRPRDTGRGLSDPTFEKMQCPTDKHRHVLNLLTLHSGRAHALSQVPTSRGPKKRYPYFPPPSRDPPDRGGAGLRNQGRTSRGK